MGTPCSQHWAGGSWSTTECAGAAYARWGRESGADASDGDFSSKAFHQPGWNVLKPVGLAKIAYQAPPSYFPLIIPSSCHLLQLPCT